MESFETILRNFVQGRIPVSIAHRALKNRADFSFRTNPAYINWREPLAADTAIPMSVGDVRAALVRYLNGEWNVDELRDWAEFITLVGAFSAPAPPPDDEDYYDELWDVVHDLALPAVFGEINQENVKDLFSRLAKYDSGMVSGAT